MPSASTIAKFTGAAALIGASTFTLNQIANSRSAEIANNEDQLGRALGFQPAPSTAPTNYPTTSPTASNAPTFAPSTSPTLTLQPSESDWVAVDSDLNKGLNIAGAVLGFTALIAAAALSRAATGCGGGNGADAEGLAAHAALSAEAGWGNLPVAYPAQPAGDNFSPIPVALPNLV